MANEILRCMIEARKREVTIDRRVSAVDWHIEQLRCHIIYQRAILEDKIMAIPDLTFVQKTAIHRLFLDIMEVYDD